jgi:diguanylate cyclase (GGDEF)-like protein/PAS domain S-box-containing protein
VAARSLDTQYAAFTLVEQSSNRFIATHGFEVGTLPRDQFFCAHTILQDEPHVVLDALKDPRFKRLGIVQRPPGIRFYAGVPVHCESGLVIGALCVFDSSPRPEFCHDDLNLLKELGIMTAQAVQSIELHPAWTPPARMPEPSVEEPTLSRPSVTPLYSTRVAKDTPQNPGRTTGLDGAELAHQAADMTPGQLQTNPKLLQRIIDSNPNPVAIKDDDGRFVIVNAAAAALFGFSPEQLIGMTEAELKASDDSGEFSRITTDLHRFYHDEPREEQLIDSQGRPRWFHVRREALRADETGTCSLTISTEITALKSTQLREAERRALMRLVAGPERLEAVTKRVVEFVEQFVGYDAKCCVWLPHKNGLRPVYSSTLPDELARRVTTLGVSIEKASPPSARENSSVLFDGPIGENLVCAPYAGTAPALGLLHCTSIPIQAGEGEVIGTLDVLTAAPISHEFALETALSAAELVSVALESRKKNVSSVYQAQYDHLTRLPNRYEMEARLGKAVAHARRNSNQVGVLILDIDHFKKYNDTLGLAVGDALLQEIAARFETCLRATDSLARMGNDEFAALVPELPDSTGATRVAQKLMAALSRPFEIAGRELVVTTSVGIAIYPNDGEEPSTLLQNADAALTRAKECGHNSFRFFAPDMHENALERLELETALRDVVASNGLEMYLQQQLNISSGALVGFEALARWNHPSLGAISPEKFIPIAEETRLIFDIGAWILEEACRALRDWRERGLPPISMAVNVSPVQLASQGFVEVVTRCIADFDVQPGELELEITESAMTNDVNDAIETLQTLRSLGVRISIDDFGTGYSGLARLQRLPIDRVKIDKSFVAGLNLDLGTDPQSSKLVQAIVTMAETFELDVVAEGVETTQQAEMLSAIGCDIAQGYLYHRPSSARSAMDTAAERVLS